VYLGLPMTGARAPAGGQKKFARLGAEDFVCKLAGPMVEQAFTEFPAAVMAHAGQGSAGRIHIVAIRQPAGF